MTITEAKQNVGKEILIDDMGFLTSGKIQQIDPSGTAILFNNHWLKLETTKLVSVLGGQTNESIDNGEQLING